MKKFIKTIILLPMWPLIWITGARANNYLDDGWHCHNNAIRMLRWRNR